MDPIFDFQEFLRFMVDIGEVLLGSTIATLAFMWILFSKKVGLHEIVSPSTDDVDTMAGLVQKHQKAEVKLTDSELSSYVGAVDTRLMSRAVIISAIWIGNAVIISLVN